MTGNLLSLNAQSVRTHARDSFLRTLFVPEPAREMLYAFYAFDLELQKIPDNVSEEIIAHIRYAWWDESLEACDPRGHPVLQALMPLVAAGHVSVQSLSGLIDLYRNHYPHQPANDSQREEIAAALLRSVRPQAEARWRRAGAAIARHRARHGKGANGWLALKLLVLR